MGDEGPVSKRTRGKREKEKKDRARDDAEVSSYTV
jgi:hypothetical protein